mmetsp:Transcript_47966/g.148048  ORF Transcript_47966/g.148048 Transcript_47966/m.148048 type:complete len:237 (-) Transcript_47966:378-1088(-)
MHPHANSERAKCSLHGLQPLRLVEARRGVQVLEGVEERPLLVARDLHLRIHGPGLDHGLLDAGADEGLAVGVPAARRLQPVHALRQALERRGGGVNAVVAHVGLGLQAQVLPVREDLAAQGVLRRLLGVGGPQDLAAEVLPRELRLVPLHGVVVDAAAGRRELAAHGHEEAVEDVHRRLPRHLHEAAIEAAAKLHELAALLGSRPGRVELIGRTAKLLAGIHGVEDDALRKGVVPR